MENNPKKPASFSYLVAVYFLSSFVGASLLLWVAGYAIGFAVDIDALFSSELITSIAFEVLYLLFLWLMVWNTAKYLRTAYVIPNPKKVIVWSAYVFIGVVLAQFAWNYLQDGVLPELLAVVATIIELAVFFVLSKKYLRS